MNVEQSEDEREAGDREMSFDLVFQALFQAFRNQEILAESNLPIFSVLVKTQNREYVSGNQLSYMLLRRPYFKGNSGLLHISLIT